MTRQAAIIAFITLSICVTGCSFTQCNQGRDALKEAGKASSGARKSSIHAVAASGRTTSAVSSVPFLIGGAAGAASGKAGSDLQQTATQPIGQPLDITDEAITVGPPPDQALNTKKPARN
jgi:hypothetical protein